MSHPSPPLLEVNFDGLVGPTHNYAGLSFGNVASSSNVGSTSRPRAAALQGIAKMRRLLALGVPQGVLPPHERPHLPTLRALGFSGSDVQVIESAARVDPVLLAQCSSASCMWTANAATVAPAADTADGLTHLLTANLVSMFHRSIEHPTTTRILAAVFSDPARFVVHPALPACPALGDEGAANHTRLFDDTQVGGSETRPTRAGTLETHPASGAGFQPATSPAFVHLFVYGAHAADKAAPRPQRFPARQTLEASRAAARVLRLSPQACVFAQQQPDVIDVGVFHNDVIAVGSGRVLLAHECAFLDEAGVIASLRRRVPSLCHVRIPESSVSVAEAVSSYLFNSQLLALAPDRYVLIAPSEATGHPRVKAALDAVVASPDNPIREVVSLDVRESMRNGGGPACLRLRVPLSPQDLARLNQASLMDDGKLTALEGLVTRHYRETLTPADLADPLLLRESRDALQQLTDLLGLGSVYDFQW